MPRCQIHYNPGAHFQSRILARGVQRDPGRVRFRQDLSSCATSHHTGVSVCTSVFSRLHDTIANDSLSSELYSCGYFLWFYSLWLLLLQADSQSEYYADYSVEMMKTK